MQPYRRGAGSSRGNFARSGYGGAETFSSGGRGENGFGTIFGEALSICGLFLTAMTG